ncbi:MAG: 50S ribosomal protein L11 methyltransferase [Acidobacteria bacterium]|nr:50S ribosomal protein L11 methyltransferase [Acidobacteriota bacterium]
MRSWPALDITVGAASDLLQAALLDYRITAIDETDSHRWRVVFASPADRDAAAGDLARRFRDLTIRFVDVPDQGWAARSQAAVRAIQVGRLIVAPPWDLPPVDDPARIVIIIHPSMGFGTGHHATTRLGLAALQALDLHGRTVLDVGTGSGVLAIAASRLGAARVAGIDDDADAIEAAGENLRLNPQASVQLRLGDLRSATPESSDVVAANLTGGLLIRSARRLQDLTAPSGRLILSGLMAHEESGVRAAFADLALIARAEEEEWVCVTLQRRA